MPFGAKVADGARGYWGLKMWGQETDFDFVETFGSEMRSVFQHRRDLFEIVLGFGYGRGLSGNGIVGDVVSGEGALFASPAWLRITTDCSYLPSGK